MRIVVDDIAAGGRQIHLDATSEDAKAVVAAALEGEVRSFTVDIDIQRTRQGATAEVTGTASAIRPCDRCGADIEFDVTVEESMTYLPESDSVGEGEIELSEKDLDIGFFEGGALDSDAVLSEAFALAAPLRVTCGGDSCPNARSLGETDASDTAGHPAFAALKDLL